MSSFNKDELIKQLVIPLYDKQWVLDQIHELYVSELHYDPNEPEELNDELEWKKRCMEGTDGSIIVGCPSSEIDGDDYDVFDFGLTSDGWLDDSGFLDYILYDRWASLEGLDIFEIGISESTCGVFVPEWAVEQFGKKNACKEVYGLLTEVIALSLTDPNNKVLLSSTKDCKAFLKEKYGSMNPKRITKRKWGVLEFRTFDDEGSSYTIVTHNDVLISHYNYAFNLNH